MTSYSQHQRCLQACTSITKAGQHCVVMSQGVHQWLKRNTGSGCLC